MDKYIYNLNSKKINVEWDWLDFLSKSLNSNKKREKEKLIWKRLIWEN